jgi:hypothetical protein
MGGGKISLYNGDLILVLFIGLVFREEQGLMIGSRFLTHSGRRVNGALKGLTSWLLGIVLIGLLTACGASQPPLNYGPDATMVKKAIEWQLEQRQNELAQQLGATMLQFQIKKVKTQGIEPLYVKKLATYHLEGSFDYQLDLDSDRHEQKHQDFDVYLQRQREGKSWRILVPVVEKADQADQTPSSKPSTSNGHRVHRWYSYLLS